MEKNHTGYSLPKQHSDGTVPLFVFDICQTSLHSKNRIHFQGLFICYLLQRTKQILYKHFNKCLKNHKWQIFFSSSNNIIDSKSGFKFLYVGVIIITFILFIIVMLNAELSSFSRENKYHCLLETIWWSLHDLLNTVYKPNFSIHKVCRQETSVTQISHLFFLDVLTF